MGSVFGKYQLLAQLGEGGMAEVFLAVLAGPPGSGFSKLTVVKKLRGNYEDDPEFINMLLDEASIAARLNHPNIVQTLEVGDVDGKYFIAMEYLDGQSFHRVQNRGWARRAQAPKDAGAATLTKDMELVVLLDVLAALHHAHELADYDGTPFSLVHRDVTPHNIFVTYEGQVKLVDFGIAKAAGRGPETRHGVIKGKMRYMAPEQALAKPVDRRADVFAAGVLLWESLTGQRRWKDQSEVTIMHALLAGDVYRPTTAVEPTTPPELDAMCKKALASDPADRYQTADEMRRELERYLVASGKLAEARAQLSPVVTSLFADKRAELKAVVEKRLSIVRSSPGSEVTPMMLTLHSGDRSSRRTLGPAASSTSSSTSTLTEASAAGERWRRPGARAAFAALGGVLVASAAFAAVRSSRREEPAARVTGATELASAVAPVTPTTSVSVSISASPPSARILLDGVVVPSPYDAKVERSPLPHVVRVEADGFEPQTKTLAFDRDVALALALTKTAPPDRPAASPRGAPAAALPPRNQVPARAAEATSAAPHASTPVAAAAPPSAAEPPAAATTAKPKKDIDRTNPFVTGAAGPKALDKSNPFEK